MQIFEFFNLLHFQNFIFDWKIIFSSVAIFIAFYSFIPYFRDIFALKTKPHLFTWLIWSVMSFIAFGATFVGDGGHGSLWAIGITTILCFFIFFLSFKYGEKNISTFDWFCLFLAFVSILLWIITKSPFYSIIIVTFIDVIAYGPTIYKTWKKPFEETLSIHFLSGIKFILIFLSLENINILTALYTVTLIFTNFIFSGFLVWRRKVVNKY